MKPDIQPVLKKETTRLAIATGIGCVLMFLVFFIGHMISPDKIPFDYRVIISGVIGYIIALLNFFLMGLAVQKVADSTDEKKAKAVFKQSYKWRLLMQVFWGVLAFVLPCFNGAAGVIPLLLPSPAIKIMGIAENKKKKGDD